jgi:inosine/xanthosine triphosphatase
MPLRFRRAAVGSTNPAKVEAVRRTLERLAPGCALDAVEAPSGVGDMPLGDEALRAGALARAAVALERTGAEIAFGLEGGALLDGERAWLTGHVIALTADGRLGEASWGRMLLPPSVVPRLRAGEELGDVIDELFARKESKRQSGAIGLLTEGAVSRTDAFADLVAMACAPFLFPELYRSSEAAQD